MSQRLKDYFYIQIPENEKRRFKGLMNDALSTEIGTRLLTDFMFSGGTVELVDKIKDSNARAQYSASENKTTLTHKSVSSDFIHELGHARQYRKRPDLKYENAAPAYSAQLSVLMEADCWALTAIYWKQFIRQNPQQTSGFLNREMRAFKHLNSITPFADKIEMSIPDHTQFEENNYTSYFYIKLRALGQFIEMSRRGYGDEEMYSPEIRMSLGRLERDVMQRRTDIKWAGTIFAKYAEGQSNEELNAHFYTEQNLDWFRKITFGSVPEAIDVEDSPTLMHRHWKSASQFLSRLPVLSEEWFSKLVSDFSDLSDIGINESYLVHSLVDGKVPDFILRPSDDLIKRAADLKRDVQESYNRANDANSSYLTAQKMRFEG